MQKWPDGEFVYHSDYQALLDELEAKDIRIGKLEVIATDYGMKFQRAQDALKHQSLLHKTQMEAAERRIAELERNEIREEGNQFLVVRHPGKLPVVKHCAGELEGFLRQLLEHDPMATIDIVTHRYYGVGGQWVQDAEEYLQMMAAAAGKGE
ncbi:ead/Ea22-like family protein [Enterobacter hormaechei subsp. xiangfangensis]|nr:ead/Ea22-like family protein [Enterobacter hormaechei]MDE4073730.1 ead/Ea22-like family protein [Enterobacter hormaechei subsp. xiangfangensis]